MPNDQLATERPDPFVEYYKQFVDREALRANLKLTPEERLLQLTAKVKDTENQDKKRRSHAAPNSAPSRWEAISDTSPERTTDPIIELYKRDVDRTLLRENLKLTPEQRLLKLTDFMRFIEVLRNSSPHPQESE